MRLLASSNFAATASGIGVGVSVGSAEGKGVKSGSAPWLASIEGLPEPDKKQPRPTKAVAVTVKNSFSNLHKPTVL